MFIEINDWRIFLITFRDFNYSDNSGVWVLEWLEMEHTFNPNAIYGTVSNFKLIAILTSI
jgi:hypothetical protein